MFLVDGRCKILKVWGGYSPKTFDGHWVRAYKEWLEDELGGAGVVADNHFSWGERNLKKVHFFVIRDMSRRH
jgi:hypothetical protein